MKQYMNYLGQLRLYSLVDLVLLLMAARLTAPQLAGSLALWVGFLLYLENGHRHSNRALFPPYCWMVFWLVGVLLFPPAFACAFILLSLVYTRKKRGCWGLASPVARGLQACVLVAAALGWQSPFTLLAGILTAARNLLGDLRDTAKDGEEGLTTWLVLFRLQPTAMPLHFVGVVATTVTWWYFAGLSPSILLAVILVEAATYGWTPR